MSEESKKPVTVKKEIRVGYDQFAGTVTVSAGSGGPAGTSSNIPEGATATEVGREQGELTPEYAVSVVASAVMEEPPVSPQAVWAYCTSVSKFYDETLKACIRRALNADVELRSIMGPPEKSRLHRSSVRKRCRQVVSLYNSEVRNSISETTAAKTKMHEALRVTIASAVRLARITSSVSELLIKEEEEELPGLDATLSGNTEEEVLAAAAAAPLDLSAAAEAVEMLEAEAAAMAVTEPKTKQEESEKPANEDTRVLAVLIQGFGDLEKSLVRHLQHLEFLVDEERMADPDDCGHFFDKMRDEFLKQVRRLEDITDDLSRRIPAKGVVPPPQRPSRLPSPELPAPAAASSVSSPVSPDSPRQATRHHKSRSHSAEISSKGAIKRGSK